MFRIAICDDEREERDYLHATLGCFTDLPPFSINMFDSGEDLCEALQAGQTYNLYILDITLKGINGVQVGRFIREMFPRNGPQVLFISSQKRYAMELFDLYPLNFLIKPIRKEKLYACMQRAMNRVGSTTLVFSYSHKRQFSSIAYGNIRYFESNNKTILIHAIDDTHRIIMRLPEVLQRDLPSNFLQVHQSFVLNFDYVRRLGHTKAILDNAEEVPISYAYRKDAREYMTKNLLK